MVSGFADVTGDIEGGYGIVRPNAYKMSYLYLNIIICIVYTND